VFDNTKQPGVVHKSGKKAASALPLFEGKFTAFEGGVRVPCVMKWPAKIPAGSICSEPAATTDLLPTLARLAGATLPDIELDGENILDLMTAKPGAETPHETLFFVYYKRALSVRSQDNR
jgi:arylsulfatase A-like enzyme